MTAARSRSVQAEKNEVAGDYRLAVWGMALAAGLAWEPPGAETIRAQLAAPAKQEAA